MSNQFVKLGEVCDFQGGSQPPKSEHIHEKKPGYIRFIQIRDFESDDYLTFIPIDKKNKICQEDDVLIARYGASIGKILTGLSGAYNVALIKCIPDEKRLQKRFLYYYLNTSKIQKFIQSRSKRSAQEGVDPKELKQQLIYLPSLETQNRIVYVLDKAQELIDKRKAQIEALDQLTQSVFLEMFGDPATNPKKWPMGFIKDLALKTQYGTSKKASEDTGKYPILRMNNITYEGHWDLTDLKYVDLDDKEVEKYLVHKGELLFNRTNSKELVGKTAVYRFEKPMAFAGYLVKLIPNEKANAEFISAYLNSKYGKSILFSMAKNIVGMANINAEELKSIKIYIPPKQLQDQFAEIVQKIESQRELFKKELVELEKNFNSLMQRAFKGELFND
ncbi:type I restriction enzyme, S subunit [Anoxybacillus pushchinoensis]|uniref:Type I restriction enzyme, S subunit n=1 Tax=Anoxybacillus pushchinoensis TaxID=150248 RepID=A0A1I0TL10_9BACL|nr:restriction endonuclease subunit S [Anoxybacillus pushchinoensis]SFA52425.1 type I restriction enzyme, S subunit [Anoxybacillus pushchinoensis]